MEPVWHLGDSSSTAGCGSGPGAVHNGPHVFEDQPTWSIRGRRRGRPGRSHRGRRRPSRPALGSDPDRKSTRLNSSHVASSYAVFCLKKKKTTDEHTNNNV